MTHWESKPLWLLESMMQPVIRAAATTFGLSEEKLLGAVDALSPTYHDCVTPFDNAELSYAAFIGLVAVYDGDSELPELVESRMWAEDEWLKLGAMLVPMFDRDDETVERLEGGWVMLGGMASHEAIHFVQAYKRAERTNSSTRSVRPTRPGRLSTRSCSYIGTRSSLR